MSWSCFFEALNSRFRRSTSGLKLGPYGSRAPFREVLALHTFPEAPQRAYESTVKEDSGTTTTTTMRWLLSFLLLGLLSVVQALSSSGSNLLVILEELAEKSKYSKYLADLEGMGIWTIVLALQNDANLVPM